MARNQPQKPPSSSKKMARQGKRKPPRRIQSFTVRPRSPTPNSSNAHQAPLPALQKTINLTALFLATSLHLRLLTVTAPLSVLPRVHMIGIPINFHRKSALPQPHPGVTLGNPQDLPDAAAFRERLISRRRTCNLFHISQRKIQIPLMTGWATLSPVIPRSLLPPSPLKNLPPDFQLTRLSSLGDKYK